MTDTAPRWHDYIELPRQIRHPVSRAAEQALAARVAAFLASRRVAPYDLTA